MDSQDDDHVELTQDELRLLKSLAHPDTHHALMGVARLVRDYKSYGRMAEFMSAVAKWLLVIAGFLIAAKAGVLSFFGIGGES